MASYDRRALNKQAPVLSVYAEGHHVSQGHTCTFDSQGLDSSK